jgi:hypothetical protein
MSFLTERYFYQPDTVFSTYKSSLTGRNEYFIIMETYNIVTVTYSKIVTLELKNAHSSR